MIMHLAKRCPRRLQPDAHSAAAELLFAVCKNGAKSVAFSTLCLPCARGMLIGLPELITFSHGKAFHPFPPVYPVYVAARPCVCVVYYNPLFMRHSSRSFTALTLCGEGLLNAERLITFYDTGLFQLKTHYCKAQTAMRETEEAFFAGLTECIIVYQLVER